MQTHPLAHISPEVAQEAVTVLEYAPPKTGLLIDAVSSLLTDFVVDEPRRQLHMSPSSLNPP